MLMSVKGFTGGAALKPAQIRAQVVRCKNPTVTHTALRRCQTGLVTL